MRILVLWAHESSTNLGVAALARGSHDLLLSVWPKAEIEFANYGHRPPAVPWGRPRSLLRERVMPQKGMQEYFKQFDLVWDTRSGDSFSDIYGAGRNVTMGMVYEFAQQAGPACVLAPQTIGPFTSRIAKNIARRNLRTSKAVYSRDRASSDAAYELGRQPDALSSDLAFGIEQADALKYRDILLNVSGLLWNENPHVDAESYRNAMIVLTQRLKADGRNVSLLAHVLDSPSSDNDVPAVYDLARRLNFEPEVLIPEDLDSARAAIASADLVIAARMHASLNALSQGVPAIPLAYSRKFAPLLEGVKWNHTVDLRSSSPDIDRVIKLSERDGLNEEASQAQQLGQASLKTVADHLGELL